jgi:2-methylaconitate cis-trans-isomerase PrpF
MLVNSVNTKKDITIQHPSGIIKVGVEFKGKEVKSAVLYSAVRLLMLEAVNIEA